MKCFDYLVSALLLLVISCNAEKEEVQRCHPIKLKQFKAKRCSVFYSNDSLKYTNVWYKDTTGKLESHGTMKRWHKNGQLKGFIKYEFGCPYDTSKGFFPDGSLARIAPYKNCEKNGVVREFYENGQIKTEYHMKNGEQFGATKMWHSNGQLSAHFIYEGDFKRTGEGYTWFEDGTIESEGIFKENETWRKYYYQDKKLKSEEHYENELLMNAKYYDQKGNLTSEIKDGNGVHCYFNEEANKYSLRFYRGGEMADQMFHTSCEVPEFLGD